MAPMARPMGGRPALGGRREPKVDVDSLELPTVVSEVSNRFGDRSLLVHGAKKIGKTSLFGTREGTLVLQFDPPQKRTLPLMEVHCPDWPTFVTAIHKLEKLAKKGPFPYKYGVIDRCDIMYRAFFTWYCETVLGGSTPAELEARFSGQVWNDLKQRFSDMVRRVNALPWTPVYICHSKTKEVDSTAGDDDKIEVLSPDLSGVPDAAITGDVDIIISYQYRGKHRVMVVRGDEYTVAGNRCRGHFETPDGRKVKEVFAGDSEEEALANLMAAFKNKQAYATVKEMLKKQAK